MPTANFPLGGAVVPIGLFLEKQLTKTVNRLFEVKFDILWGLDASQNLHSAIGDLPLGLEYYEAYAKTDAGQMAELYDGTADDVPVVEVSLGKLGVVPCAMFIMGMHYNTIQLEKMRTAQAIGADVPTVNIVAAKQAAVADYFNRRMHNTVLYGYPLKGLRGIFSLAGIAETDTTFTPYKKASGEYTITTKQLYNDLSDLFFYQMDKMRLSNAGQLTAVFPPHLMRRLVEIYNDTSGLTIKQMLMSSEVGMGIGNIVSRNELKGSELNKYVWNESGTGFYPTTTDRIMFKANSYNLERHFFARRGYPVFQTSSIKYEQVYLEGTSGIFNFEPEYVSYYDFSNALV